MSTAPAEASADGLTRLVGPVLMTKAAKQQLSDDQPFIEPMQECATLCQPKEFLSSLSFSCTENRLSLLVSGRQSRVRVQHVVEEPALPFQPVAVHHEIGVSEQDAHG